MFSVVFALADLRAPETSSAGPKFFYFHAVFSKKLSNSGFTSPWGKSWICHWFVYLFEKEGDLYPTKNSAPIDQCPMEYLPKDVGR